MRRIYFLLPGIDDARELVDAFRRNGYQDRDLHLVARQDVPMEDLPEASLTEQSDLLPALKRGTAVGGTVGLLAGLGAVALPGVGVAVGGGAVAAMTAAGATFGGWSATLVGAGMDRKQIADCEQALQEGKVLMLVDVEAHQVDAVRETVTSHYPDVEVEDIERVMPAPDVLAEKG
ncbi:DUF1269 domain-containing protein [Methylonatrum kenyense]|uniref:DUF1269 domain-containing protein n=1 Tax=Methylonatrum kenyense TaxID=455253 RepID=UPI0020BE72A4|nr:DUF1269 domain-containing protein [Methylonatrum kenyense]MCK8516064.1 DUF1269 domain-containing protein [Methylonatrum kenyense]